MELRHCLLAIVIVASGCETAPRNVSPIAEANRYASGFLEEMRLLRSAKVGDQVDLRFLKPRPNSSNGDTASYFTWETRGVDRPHMIYVIDREGRIERITEEEPTPKPRSKWERESDEKHALQKLAVGMEFPYMSDIGIPDRIHEFNRRSVYVFERGGVRTRITVDNQTHQIVDISRTY